MFLRKFDGRYTGIIGTFPVRNYQGMTEKDNFAT